MKTPQNKNKPVKASITVIEVIPTHKKGIHMDKLAKSLKMPFGGNEKSAAAEKDPDLALEEIYGSSKEDKDFGKLTLAEASINQLKAALKKKEQEEKAEGENPEEEADESGEEEVAEHMGGGEEEDSSSYS